MPQLHFYVSKEVAAKIKQRALSRKLPVSRYVAEVVRRDVADKGWPEGYFEKFCGAWKGKPLKRPPQGRLEERDELFP